MKNYNRVQRQKNPLLDDRLPVTGNTLLIISREDLIEFARICANLDPAKQIESPEIQDVEKPISQPEAIKFLGKSRQTLIKWRKMGIIQAHQLGGRIYYMPSELLASLQKLD